MNLLRVRRKSLNLYIIALIFILLNFYLLSSVVFGNSAPILIEESPGFSIAPMDNSSIAIIKEYLEFDIFADKGDFAKVTASYEMLNTSDVFIKQNMIFPYITSPRDTYKDRANISVNGNPIQYQTIRLTDLPETNFNSMQYKDKSNKELASLINIDNIIDMVNSNNSYESKNFRLQDPVRVYTLHMPIEKEPHRAEVTFESVNLESQILLHYNFNSFSLNNDGTGKLGTWSSMESSNLPQEKSYIAIMGNIEEQVEITSLTDHKITVEDTILVDFLKEVISESEGMYHNSDLQNDVYDIEERELIEYISEEIDTRIGRKESFFSLDGDGISAFYNSTYLAAFIYSVDFAPKDIVNVTVEYEMQATIDRRKTREFSNMFLYLLNPASRWKDFGDLNIKVIPSEEQPYIIGSSLPLVRDNTTSIYTGEFDGLPNDDFYFITYMTEEPDPPQSKYLYIVSYLLHMFYPFIIIALLSIGIVYWLYRVNKK